MVGSICEQGFDKGKPKHIDYFRVSQNHTRVLGSVCLHANSSKRRKRGYVDKVFGNWRHQRNQSLDVRQRWLHKSNSVVSSGKPDQQTGGVRRGLHYDDWEVVVRIRHSGERKEMGTYWNFQCDAVLLLQLIPGL